MYFLTTHVSVANATLHELFMALSMYTGVVYGIRITVIEGLTDCI